MQCHVFVKKCLSRQDCCGGQRIVYRKGHGVWFAVRLIMFWTRNPHVMLAKVATVSVAPKQGWRCDVQWATSGRAPQLLPRLLVNVSVAPTQGCGRDVRQANVGPLRIIVGVSRATIRQQHQQGDVSCGAQPTVAAARIDYQRTTQE